MKKIKICVVTSTRAEYGVLRWLMEEIKNDEQMRLQLLVTGAHLSREFGLTFREIEKDGFKIDAKVNMHLSLHSKAAIVKSMGQCSIGIAKAFERLKPDLIIVLGDRYELLSVCSSAVVMNIPIAHISGGDITEGAIDEQTRHAITKMAHLHFPGTEASAKRIIQMGEGPGKVFAVGELGVDNFRKLKAKTKSEIAAELGLDKNKKWILFTYHPETAITLDENLKRVANVLSVLRKIKGVELIITYPNADYGGRQIIDLLKKQRLKEKGKFHLLKNLGSLRYISLMMNSSCLIGNSSSGITESPSAKIPTLNIGNRQKGRIIPKNIICVSGSRDSIKKGLVKSLSGNFRKKLVNLKNPYGSGTAAKNIVRVLRRIRIGGSLLNKKFTEI